MERHPARCARKGHTAQELLEFRLVHAVIALQTRTRGREAHRLPTVSVISGTLGRTEAFAKGAQRALIKMLMGLHTACYAEEASIRQGLRRAPRRRVLGALSLIPSRRWGAPT